MLLQFLTIVCHSVSPCSGYWHGRVAVRAREAKDVSDLSLFLQEVLTLSCIRHQNIQLFMGAAIEPEAHQPLILIMR